ncbi:MAG: hypothetical protein F6J96_23935 [Symploca sp. SIO1C2]|nr:hypothetical protein [Symploca sp. SIO1C2]
MAKDIYHKTVRVALEKEGWLITDDPLCLTSKGFITNICKNIINVKLQFGSEAKIRFSVSARWSLAHRLCCCLVSRQ